jgi:hypothetical protein
MRFLKREKTQPNINNDKNLGFYKIQKTKTVFITVNNILMVNFMIRGTLNG